MSKLKKALPLLALASLSYLLLKPKKSNNKPLNLPNIESLYHFWLAKHLFQEEILEDLNEGILYEKHHHYKLNETTLDYYLGATDSIKHLEIHKYKNAHKAILKDYIFIYENDGSIANLSILYKNTILNLTTFDQDLFHECLEELNNFYNPKWK